MGYEATNTRRCQRGAVEIVLVLGGLALGALTGILYAPRAGERTRRHLRRRFEDVRDRVAEVGDDVTTSIGDARHSLARRIAAGQASVGKSRRTLASVSERWRTAWAR